MRIRFASIGLLLAGWIAGLMPGAARACTCLPPPPPAEALADADAVFLGKVARIATAPAEANRLARVRVTFVVREAWKGVGAVYTDVYTARDGASCGYGFRKEETYLVYAYAGDGGRTLQTSLCTRTRPLDQAAEDLAVLGDGTVWDTDDGRACGGPTNAAAVQVVFFTLLGLGLGRRRFGGKGNGLRPSHHGDAGRRAG